MWGTHLSKPHSGSAISMAPAELEDWPSAAMPRPPPPHKSGLMSPLLSARTPAFPGSDCPLGHN